jgi:lysophospholipase L1-like esterase
MNMENKMKFFFVLILLVLMKVTQAQELSPFQQKERVAFVGNSITDGGHYHSYIWLYYMTHFPLRRIDIFNAGIGGDVAEQMYNRLDDDVFSKKPTTVTLTFGMNDTKYYEFLWPNPDSSAKVNIEKSYQSYLKIEKRFKEFQGKVILIASSPYDDVSKIKNVSFHGKNKAMLKIADLQQQSAHKNNWGFVDFNRPMTSINVNMQKQDTLFTLCGTDRIHPGNDGHMVMAYFFLKAQGLAGKKVADICINKSTRKIEKSDNCKVQQLSFDNSTIGFDYDANSLPYPVDTIARGWGATRKQSDALDLIPFTSEFNQELISIKGLEPAGNYQMMIDGMEIGKWTGSDFEKGINLAENSNTPQYQQSLAVLHINEERWELEKKLRNYYWMEYSVLSPLGLKFKDDAKTLDTLKILAKNNGFINGNLDNYSSSRFKLVRDAWQKEIDVLVNEIYSINIPKKHQFLIKKVG